MITTPDTFQKFQQDNQTGIQVSPTIGKLTAALQKFQRSCPKIPKSSKNPFLNSRYADLATILDLIKEPLLDAELSVLQMPVGEFGLTTLLAHTSGEWICSTYHMQPLESVIDKATKEKAITPQSLGSVITYQRRYAIGAILNLNIDDDNDAQPGNGQVNNAPEPTVKKLTARELMEQAKVAAATAQTQTAPLIPSTQVEVIPPTTNTNTTTMLMASEDGKHSEPTSNKCSEQLSSQIKSELKIWEQSSPGVSGKFVSELQASGYQKITDLPTSQAKQILNHVSTRNIGNFFQQSLEKITA